MSGMSPIESAPAGPGVPPTPSQQPEREFTIKARTQGQMVRRRFIRHRGAVIGFSALMFVIVMAYTSIGFWKIPGWWDLGYSSTNPIVNEGSPTLDLVPWFDGDGLTAGPHPIEVRLQNRGGFTHIYLSWTPPDGATEIIPPDRLSPHS